MRNRWLAYAASFLAASALVAASVFVPSALLQRRENDLVGKVTVIPYGDYPGRSLDRATATPPAGPAPSASASAPGPAGQGDSPSEIILKKILLFESGNDTTMLETPSSEDIAMKQITLDTIDRVQKLMIQDALPPVANFPDDADVSASLHRISDSTGSEHFDYWGVTFLSDPERTKASHSVSLIVDAQSGQIFGIKMYTATAVKSFDLQNAVETIAQTLQIKGSARLVRGDEKEPSTAYWISTDRSVDLKFTFFSSAEGTSFIMSISSAATRE